MAWHRLPRQPLCRYCGGAIAKATITIWFAARDNRDDTFSRSSTAKPRSQEEAQRLFNERILSIRWEDDEAGRYIYKASLWDGESYVDLHFCKRVCSELMGRAAVARGMETMAYRNAMQRVAEEC